MIKERHFLYQGVQFFVWSEISVVHVASICKSEMDIMQRLSVSSYACMTDFCNWSDFWTTLYTLAVNGQHSRWLAETVWHARRRPAIRQPASLELKRVLLQMFYCLLINWDGTESFITLQSLLLATADWHRQRNAYNDALRFNAPQIQRCTDSSAVQPKCLVVCVCIHSVSATVASDDLILSLYFVFVLYL